MGKTNLICVLWILILGPSYALPSPGAPSVSQTTCPPGKVDCGPDSQQCIPQDFMCDQLEDCSNGWDEMEQNCPCDGFSCPFNSTATKCIPSYWVCDNLRDCPGGEDEVRPCPPCGPRHFRCVSDERCISTFFVCNGEKDCVDGSDEFICPSQTREE